MLPSVLHTVEVESRSLPTCRSEALVCRSWRVLASVDDKYRNERRAFRPVIQKAGQVAKVQLRTAAVLFVGSYHFKAASAKYVVGES